MEIYTLESVGVLDQFIHQLAERLVSRDSYANCASFVAEFINEHCGEGPREGTFFKGDKIEDTLNHETGLAWSAFFPPEHSNYIRHLMEKDAQEQLFNLLVELPGFVFFQEKSYRQQDLRDSLLKHCRGYLVERGIKWTEVIKSANKKRLFSKGIPGGADIVDLTVRLDTEAGKPKDERKSMNAVAREFTGETTPEWDKSRAKKLLARIRRNRNRGIINLEWD